MLSKPLAASLLLATIALAFMPTASAGKLFSECVDGDETCLCVSDLNASCYDSHSDQSDCRVSVGTSTQHWNGYMCGAIVDLPERAAAIGAANSPAE